jgi:hypothetical protein
VEVVAVARKRKLSRWFFGGYKNRKYKRAVLRGSAERMRYYGREHHRRSGNRGEDMSSINAMLHLIQRQCRSRGRCVS